MLPLDHLLLPLAGGGEVLRESERPFGRLLFYGSESMGVRVLSKLRNDGLRDLDRTE